MDVYPLIPPDIEAAFAEQRRLAPRARRRAPRSVPEILRAAAAAMDEEPEDASVTYLPARRAVRRNLLNIMLGRC